MAIRLVNLGDSPCTLFGRVIGNREHVDVLGTDAQVRRALTGSTTGAYPRGLRPSVVDDAEADAPVLLDRPGTVRPVRIATAAALPAHTRTVATGRLTANANGALTVDGVAAVAGNRVLVKDEGGGTHLENLIYDVTDPGAAGAPWILDPAVDFNQASEVQGGVSARVSEGTAHGNQEWYVQTDDPIVVGTTAVVWDELTGTPSGPAGGQLGGTYPNPTVTLGLAANGIVARTAAATWAARTIAVAGGSAAALSVADGDGVAAAPTFSVDAGLISLAALAMGADLMPYTTADNVWASTALTAAGRAILDDASAAAQRTTLGLVIGTDVQAWDADLDAIAALGNGIVARTGAGTAAARTITAGVGVVVTDGSGVAGNPTLATRDQQDLRLLLAVDSQLTGAGLGAATEGAHTALTMPSANINEARRTIRFKALLAVDSDNGADTWQARVRVGGLAGTLIADTGAINIVAGEDLWIEGVIQIRTAGAGGTFQSQVLVTGEGAWPTARTYTSAGAINTTVDRDLTITGTSSSASAAQQVTLRYFEAEIYDA